MNIERKCLDCFYAVKDPGATPDQIIQGAVPSMCLLNPPVTVPLVTQRGMAMVTAYPQVNAQTISCARWADGNSEAARIAGNVKVQ